MSHSGDVAQILLAGVWRRLARADRACMRLSCKEARRMADQLLDSAVLCVPPPGCSADGEWPPAADAAAFHSRMHAPSTLTVKHTCAEWRHQHRVDSYYEQYAASAAGRLPASSCVVEVGRGPGVSACAYGVLPAAALAAVVRALPQLQRLSIVHRAPSSPVTVEVAEESLAALVPCATLRTLHFGCGINIQGGIVSNMGFRLKALGDLAQLRELHCEWQLYEQAMQLVGTLPSLEYLSARAFEATEGPEVNTFAALRLISGPLRSKHGAGSDAAAIAAGVAAAAPPDAAGCSAWDPRRAVCCVGSGSDEISGLLALPELQALQRCELRVEANDLQEAGTVAALQAAAARFAACAHSWVLRVVVCDCANPASWRTLTPGSLPHVRNLIVEASSDHDEGWEGMPQATISKKMMNTLRVLLAALPQLEALSLEGVTLSQAGCALVDFGDMVPLAHRVDVVLAALRAAPRSLRELWLCGPGHLHGPDYNAGEAAAHCASHLAERLVIQQQQLQPQGRPLLPPALRVMVQGARSATVAACNGTLSAAGLAACFESWSRFRTGGVGDGSDEEESTDSSDEESSWETVRSSYGMSDFGIDDEDGDEAGAVDGGGDEGEDG